MYNYVDQNISDRLITIPPIQKLNSNTKGVDNMKCCPFVSPCQRVHTCNTKMMDNASAFLHDIHEISETAPFSVLIYSSAPYSFPLQKRCHELRLQKSNIQPLTPRLEHTCDLCFR
jgi:hypothetical protein